MDSIGNVDNEEAKNFKVLAASLRDLLLGTSKIECFSREQRAAFKTAGQSRKIGDVNTAQANRSNCSETRSESL